MNLIPMLAWWQWLILLAIPPLIVLLYFLKLRRQPVSIPSTYLWRRAIEDLHVNSIWQRLRKNLLLLLQLAAVGLLILACLRPGFSGTSSIGSRSVFLIDNSASMQATDLGKSRLRAAQDKVLEMIDALQNNDAAMVIAFSNAADVRQGFTTDRRKLRQAVDGIQPTNRSTDLNEALRAAAGLANPGRTSQLEDLADVQVADALPATLYVLSDGGFAPPQIQLGNLDPKYIPIGSTSADNVAVLAFTADRNSEKPEQVEAFARVRNFSSQPRSVTASLMFNDQLVDAADIQLQPNGESGATFQLNDIAAGKLKIELDVADDFKLDNVAYAGLDPPRELKVILATAGNNALETALATPQAQAVASVSVVKPAELASDEVLRLANSGTVDLFIYDACVPPQLPNANTLFLGSLPPKSAWSATPPAGPVFIIDSNRQHPIMQYVDMGTVRIVEGASLKPPADAVELLRSDSGILMAVAPRETYQDAVLGFGLTTTTDKGEVPNTDWPIKRSFPVFLLNSLDYLGGAVSNSGSPSLHPGESAVLSWANRFSKVQVIDPQQRQHPLERAGTNQLSFSGTEDLGFYAVQPIDGSRDLQLFTVNLFSERESSIAVSPDIVLGDERVSAVAARETLRREFWRWMLALALCVLVIEWMLYARRVAV